MHLKAFFATSLSSHAAKSLDSLGNSAWGAWGGAREKLNLPLTLKEPSIRSTARVLPKATQTLYPQLDCNLQMLVCLSPKRGGQDTERFI